MGQAKARGTRNERIEQSIRGSEDDDAEIIIFLKATDAQLNVQIAARDETPNQDSPAVILASYLSANMDQLIAESQQAHRAFVEGEKQEAAPEDPPEQPLRLLDPNGGWVS